MGEAEKLKRITSTLSFIEQVVKALDGSLNELSDRVNTLEELAGAGLAADMRALEDSVNGLDQVVGDQAASTTRELQDVRRWVEVEVLVPLHETMSSVIRMNDVLQEICK